MKKSELLKMRPGTYLATDNICNYVYELEKFETGTIQCAIRERGSLSCNCVFITYDSIESFEDGYVDGIDLKRLSFSAHIGGLSVFSNIGHYYGIMTELQIVGLYNEETFREDFRKYKMHYKIGLDKYYKKRYFEK